MPKGIPLTEEELARCRHEIFHRVVKIFLKKGFHETPMQEIAKVAGLGKSTLYDYFKTKDEILVYFFEDQLNDMTEEAQKSPCKTSPQIKGFARSSGRMRSRSLCMTPDYLLITRPDHIA